MEVCTFFHSLLENDRQFLLHTLYTDNKGHGSEVELVPDLKDDRDQEAYVRKRTQWHLLDREVCIFAFARFLGIGVKKLYRGVHLAIDGRRALPAAAIGSNVNSPQLWRW